MLDIGVSKKVIVNLSGINRSIGKKKGRVG